VYLTPDANGTAQQHTHTISIIIDMLRHPASKRHYLSTMVLTGYLRRRLLFSGHEEPCLIRHGSTLLIAGRKQDGWNTMDKTVLFITGRGALNLDEGKTSKARVQCSGVG